MRVRGVRLFLPVVLIAANLGACLAFYFTRAPDYEFYARRRAMEATGSMVISSADPQHFADRPFYGFGFHGRDIWWLRWLLMVNAPAVILSRLVESQVAFSLLLRHPRLASHCLDYYSWFRAIALVGFSSLQWLVIGLSASFLLSRQPRAAA